MELISLAKADKSLFQGNNGTVSEEMLLHLGLSGRVKFPIRRLVTLWNNIELRNAVTLWCDTAIGKATFNISLWDEMTRNRVDDVSYIFRVLINQYAKS